MKLMMIEMVRKAEVVEGMVVDGQSGVGQSQKGHRGELAGVGGYRWWTWWCGWPVEEEGVKESEIERNWREIESEKERLERESNFDIKGGQLGRKSVDVSCEVNGLGKKEMKLIGGEEDKIKIKEFNFKII